MEKKQEKRQYAMEYKLDAVNLDLNEGYSVPKAAEQLGISPNCITRNDSMKKVV